MAFHSSPVVRTTLNYYLEPSKGGADYCFPATVSDKRRRHDPQQVDIVDMRGHEHDFNVDVQGFQIVRSPSSEETFDDEERIKGGYYRECANLIQKCTGATRVHVLRHVTRKQTWEQVVEAEKDLKDDEAVTAPTPLRYIHVDYSYEGATSRLATELPDEAETLSKTRWAVMNVWRPIEAVTRDGLAMCDARTIPESDLASVRGIFPQPKAATGDYKKAYGSITDVSTWHVKPPQAPGQHKWYYASQMTPDEALLLKIFDSKNDGTAKRSPHTSFQADTDFGPPRQSIEVRCLCFWEDQPAE